MGSMPRTVWVVAIVIQAGGLSSAAFPAERAGASLSRAPYVQMGAPDAMTIVWRTQGRIEPTVRFGTRADRLDQRVQPDRVDAALERLRRARHGHAHRYRQRDAPARHRPRQSSGGSGSARMRSSNARRAASLSLPLPVK